MWRQTLKATLALVVVGLASTAAYAHADLKAAVPAADGSTKTEVKETPVKSRPKAKAQERAKAAEEASNTAAGPA